MPDLMTIYCYTCPSNRYWEKEVIGSKGDKYLVVYDDMFGWRCSCPGFIYNKHCKHIKQVEKQRCGWNWEAYCGAVGTPKEGPTGKLCPMCNEEVEIVKVGV
jgi:hypothetical protein